MTARHADSVSWEAARRLARTLPSPMPRVEVALDSALGATLADPVHALVPVPAFDSSAMDGFAVAGGASWTVVGRVLAGEEPPSWALGDGECAEVATGAPVPAGTCAVLPHEEAARQGDTVSGAASTGRHVRRQGEGCPAGQRLIPAGRIVTPPILGLAASVGHDHLRVVRRPRVGVLVTGDEVVDSGIAGPGQVRDAIGPMLPGSIEDAGGELTATRRVRDDPTGLEQALLDAGNDVVVVCGASSVGPADHLRRSLGRLDAELVVGGVRCRPGHPQLLARLPDGRWVVGLPGNPYAALVAVLTLLEPLLAACAGRAPEPAEHARLEGDLRAHDRDTRLVAVRRTADAVAPVGHDRPGVLWGAALADALAVVPPGWSGDRVELVALPFCRVAAAPATTQAVP
ncbi:MAG: molybdopterin molybdotransferase MoeA [Nocardioidaceae bacterium]